MGAVSCLDGNRHLSSSKTLSCEALELMYYLRGLSSLTEAKREICSG